MVTHMKFYLKREFDVTITVMVTSKSLFAKLDPAQNAEAGDVEEKIWSCAIFFVQFVDDFPCQLSAGIHPRILSPA